MIPPAAPDVMAPASPAAAVAGPHRAGPDWPFLAALCVLGGTYVLLILAMLAADLCYTTPSELLRQLDSEEIRYSIKLSLLSCTLTTIFSLWVAVPIGYLMSRFDFPGKNLLDAILDIPIVLPPLVIGLSLLVLFSFPVGTRLLPNGKALEIPFNTFLREEFGFGVTFTVGAVVLAQFMVAAAFAVRTMRATFDQIDRRREEVALTLGCRRSQAFWMVVLPEARRGILTAGTLAWARALGEFGPILIFAGTVRGRTEVLPSSVFLEFTVGNLEGALAVSLLMVAAAVAVLMIVRFGGGEELFKSSGAPWRLRRRKQGSAGGGLAR